MDILLENCRLIPELSDGIEGCNTSILVHDGKIEKIDPSGNLKLNEFNTIDCEGKTLLPGLIDLHVHICTAGCGIGVEYFNDFDLMLKASESAKSSLRHGFTTIRDMGSTNGVATAIRNMVDGGIFAGPRVISGGKMIIPSGLLDTSDENTAYRSVSGIEEIKKAVRIEAGESKADVIKIYASGSAYNPGGEPQKAILQEEEIREAVKMADFVEKKVAAHCHSNKAIHYCLDSGVYTIEHGSYIDAAGIEKLKAEKSYLIPTMTPYSYIKGTNPNAEADNFAYNLRTKMGKDIAPHIEAAYKANLKLGFGTDTADGNFVNGIGAEFKMRKESCHMNNKDILLQATKISAYIAGLEGVCGEIKEGLDADLILVDGNPDENIEVMYKTPEMVFKAGNLVTK